MSSVIAFTVGVFVLVTVVLWSTGLSFHRVLMSENGLRIAASLSVMVAMTLFGIMAVATAF